jgi:hypothetical protein
VAKLKEVDFEEVHQSKHYGKFKLISYHGWHKVEIRFMQTGYSYLTSYGLVRSGKVKDPYYPSVHGVGYCGEGPYPLSFKRGGKKVNTPAYEVWLCRIKSCYGESKSSHLYVDATMCDEWHNFQNFAKWFYEQVRLYGKGGNVDKDLCFLGNKYYSPETARYIPKAINSLFTGSSGNTAGVHFDNNRKKFIAQIQKGELTTAGKKRQSYLGAYNTYEEAEKVYVEAKLMHVRATALKYQEQLPPDIFYKLYTGAENYVNYYMSQKENNNE